ncbi:MAG: hypothetical protein AB3N10_10210 [Allomuricauda sp.]
MKIATYKFGNIGRKITVVLREDRIQISGRPGDGGYFEDEIEIKNLSGKKYFATTGNDLRRALCALPGFVIILGTIYFWASADHSSTTIALSALVIGVIFLFGGLTLAKEDKYFGYKNFQGEVLFAISNAGNKREDFDNFILELDKVIKAQQVAGGDAAR